MAKAIPAEERVTNLVVALMATDIGLTKQQIVENVSGYRQRNESGVSADALDKMFERDKSQLRTIGIPVETIPDFANPKDLRSARYRIPKSDYELPEDIEFTPEEIAIMQLAGSVWSAGSMSDDAQSGVRKIRALGIDGDEPIIGLTPRLNAGQTGFLQLQEAIEQSVAVQFDYLKPGEPEARRREIDPLVLFEYEARWHVVGIDHVLSEPRTFLLSRIVGEVVVTNKPYNPELREGAGDRALADFAELAARNIATLEFTPGTEAALRLAKRASRDFAGYKVSYVDLDLFADELASYGPEVRVIAPEQLKAAVIARLRAAAEAHGGVL
jgi:proteasome accessory factor B